MTPIVLGLLAVLLAGPVPAVLVRVPRLRRTPRAAMVLWQSVALAAVLAALGAGLSLTTGNTVGEHAAFAWVVAVAALALTLLVLARLLLSGHRVGTDLRVLRRRHREQVDLLSRTDPAGVRVLEHDIPVAYCLPGVRSSRVVVSAGTLGLLEHDEVDAVLAHERAHLRARHDLVLEAFGVLHQAFPRWVSSRAALGEVRLLVEVLADAAATRATGRRQLGRALVALAEARSPGLDGDVTLAASGGAGDLLLRVELLGDPGPHRLQSALLLVLALGVLVLPTAFVVAPWLAGLA
jgi:Zn-dependent protease with chaperone function